MSAFDPKRTLGSDQHLAPVVKLNLRHSDKDNLFNKITSHTKRERVGMRVAFARIYGFS
jgi:hypothetical protein